MTKEELQACCATWQQRLRLQDWSIKLEVKDRDDMTGGVGSASLGSLRAVTIHILQEGDLEAVSKSFPGPSEVWLDQEVTLVHELLHLHMHDIAPKCDATTPLHDAIERAIDAISQALVAGYRAQA